MNPITHSLVPCLWLDDQAEQAARFYTETFAGGRVTNLSRYPESFDNPGAKPRGSVLTVEFEIAGQRFTALNGGPQFTINPSISFFVRVDSKEQAARLYSTLAAGGNTLMPLDAYSWSEQYAWVEDRYGVSWQIITGPRPAGGATIVPCLMFTQAQPGTAQQAMDHYTAIFPGSGIDEVARYDETQGNQGDVVHGRFHLGGQEMIAMDSHAADPVSFTEGLSLQVMCDTQDQIDSMTAALSDGGDLGPCGWLKDRFGLSWQIVPASIARWMTSDDVSARDRTFQAMLGMHKLDIAALQAAFDGRA